MVGTERKGLEFQGIDARSHSHEGNLRDVEGTTQLQTPHEQDRAGLTNFPYSPSVVLLGLKISFPLLLNKQQPKLN